MTRQWLRVYSFYFHATREIPHCVCRQNLFIHQRFSVNLFIRAICCCSSAATQKTFAWWFTCPQSYNGSLLLPTVLEVILFAHYLLTHSSWSLCLFVWDCTWCLLLFIFSSFHFEWNDTKSIVLFMEWNILLIHYFSYVIKFNTFGTCKQLTQCKQIKNGESISFLHRFDVLLKFSRLSALFFIQLFLYFTILIAFK